MSTRRFPIIPLEYKDKYTAIPRELIVDYDNKKIFAADQNGNII